MPWNGLGSYTPPAASFPEINGQVIDANRYNPTITDLAAGISAALAKNGENSPTANLPMGGFKHTGAGDASAAGQYLVYGQTTSVLLGGDLQIPNAQYIKSKIAAGTVTRVLGIDASDNLYFGSRDAPVAAMLWVNNGAELARLTTTGLGVGGTPTAKLHVFNATGQMLFADNGDGMYIGSASTAQTLGMSVGGNYGTAQNAALKLTGGASPTIDFRLNGAVVGKWDSVGLVSGSGSAIGRLTADLAASGYAGYFRLTGATNNPGVGIYLDEAANLVDLRLANSVASPTFRLVSSAGPVLASVDSAGLLTATSLAGAGSAITALNASNVSSGTLANARTTGATAATANTLALRDANGDSAIRGLTLGNVAIAGNVLDWYEEGSFTPTVTGIAPTYATQIGSFQRIGNRVYFQLQLAWTGGTNATPFNVDGLPYAANNTQNVMVDMAVNSSTSAFTWTGQLAAWVVATSTQISINAIASGAAATSLLNPNAGTKTLSISGSYLV